MKVVVAGANGFVGKALVKKLLSKNFQVVALTRKADAFKNLPTGNLQVEVWDGRETGPWIKHMEDADAVVNLAGEGIANKRWTTEQKRHIKGSRLASTRALINGIARNLSRPRVLVNASAVGFYGLTGDQEINEHSPKGKGFLADLCADWEDEAKKAEPLGMRVLLLRLGVVIDKDGGALQKMIPPFRSFVGGPLGSGKQWFPWVHRGEVINIILYAIENETLSGPLNVVAPQTLTMKQFCQELGKAMKRPCWAPVPSFVLQTLLGEMSQMLLTGQKVIPKRLLDAGYQFQYPRLPEAFTKIFS